MAHAETVDKVVAIVNNEPVTLYELDKLMAEKIDDIKKIEGGLKKEKFGDYRDLALKRLIEDKLLDQAIAKRQITVTQEDVNKAIANILKRNNMTKEQLVAEVTKKGKGFDAYVTDLKGQLLRVKFMGQAIAPRIKVTDADLDEYFAKHPDQFGSYSSVKIAQIIIPLAPDASDSDLQAAQAQAQEIIKKARGGSNFEQLGKKYGQNSQTAIPATFQVNALASQIGEAVSNLKPGEVSEPVRSDMGLNVIKLFERSTLGGEEYKSVREQIRDKVFEEKLDEELQRYIDELKTKSYIVIKQ
jgi:peptidyl-prolyl cis-trans isomerase SurA